MLKSFESHYPSLNIFLDRGDIPYTSEGRYGTLESAIDMDNLVLEKLEKVGVKYTKFLTKEEDKILEFVIDAIKSV